MKISKKIKKKKKRFTGISGRKMKTCTDQNHAPKSHAPKKPYSCSKKSFHAPKKTLPEDQLTENAAIQKLKTQNIYKRHLRPVQLVLEAPCSPQLPEIGFRRRGHESHKLQ